MLQCGAVQCSAAVPVVNSRYSVSDVVSASRVLRYVCMEKRGEWGKRIWPGGTQVRQVANGHVTAHCEYCMQHTRHLTDHMHHV